MLCTSSMAASKTNIAINQFVNHVALDAANNGIRQAFADRGYGNDKINIMYANAQGSITNAVQIAKNQASKDPEFIIGIATPSAQVTAKSANDNTKVGFVAVTDPEAANLVGYENIYGISDFPPIEDLINIVTKVFPGIKNIGVVYNSGEINSVKMVAMLEEINTKNNVGIKKVVINNSSDIKGALVKLDKQVDLIYLPQDNTIVAALDSIVAIAKKMNMPLVANDPSLVEKGVLMALGSNYYKSGMQLGNMIIDVIEGKEISNKIQKSNISELIINFDTAKALNLSIPNEVLEDKRLVK